MLLSIRNALSISDYLRYDDDDDERRITSHLWRCVAVREGRFCSLSDINDTYDIIISNIMSAVMRATAVVACFQW